MLTTIQLVLVSENSIKRITMLLGEDLQEFLSKVHKISGSVAEVCQENEELTKELEVVCPLIYFC